MGGNESKDQYAEDFAASFAADALSGPSPVSLNQRMYTDGSTYAATQYKNVSGSRSNFAQALSMLSGQPTGPKPNYSDTGSAGRPRLWPRLRKSDLYIPTHRAPGSLYRKVGGGGSARMSNAMQYRYVNGMSRKRQYPTHRRSGGGLVTGIPESFPRGNFLSDPIIQHNAWYNPEGISTSHYARDPLLEGTTREQALNPVVENMRYMKLKNIVHETLPWRDQASVRHGITTGNPHHGNFGWGVTPYMPPSTLAYLNYGGRKYWNKQKV